MLASLGRGTVADASGTAARGCCASEEPRPNVTEVNDHAPECQRHGLGKENPLLQSPVQPSLTEATQAVPAHLTFAFDYGSYHSRRALCRSVHMLMPFRVLLQLLLRRPCVISLVITHKDPRRSEALSGPSSGVDYWSWNT